MHAGTFMAIVVILVTFILLLNSPLSRGATESTLMCTTKVVCTLPAHPRPAVRHRRVARHTPCFVVSFDVRNTPGILMETPRQFQAETHESWPSAAEAYLHPDMKYAFVLAHIDVSDAELADMEHDACFGVQDVIGFHQGVTPCAFCAGTEYPPPAFIREYAAERGVQLPAEEPHGAFQFPCAEGKCELLLPLRYAARAAMYCSAVQRYNISVVGYKNATADFRFDLVSAAEGARSLALGKSRRGDIYLRDTAGDVRHLSGAYGY